MQWYRLRLAKVRDLIILTLIKEFKNYEDIFKKDKKFLHLNLGINYEEINKIGRASCRERVSSPV